MAYGGFNINLQPDIEAIMGSYNVKEYLPVSWVFPSAATINASELLTNVNPKVKFMNLMLTCYNLEGATITLRFQTQAPLNLHIVAITNITSILLSNTAKLLFDKISFAAGLANAGTTLTFTGFRITLV
jgi:hypothetical protein